ncbi:MAG: acyltransferase [Armatimonadetes bacterium]|nr:acyltransferase [Armatimonadota bacterium]
MAEPVRQRPASVGRSGRLQSLDLLRCVAVLGVLVVHFQQFYGWKSESLAGRAWGRLMFAGGTGVDLFFVLSGFLVSGLLFVEYQKHGDLRGWTFLIRRGFKIYPNYYLLIVGTFLVDGWRGEDVAHYARVFGGQCLYVHNYFAMRWDHTWSLAIEEHFYFLLTGCLVLLARSRRGEADPFRSLAWILPLAGLAVIGLRVLTAVCTGRPYGFEVNMARTHLRIDELGWGVWLAYWYHFRRPALTHWVNRRRGWIAFVSALCYLPALLDGSRSFLWVTLTFTSVALGGVGVVALAMIPRDGSSPRPPGRLKRAMAFVGFHSYSIYLFHRPVETGFVWLSKHGFLPQAEGWPARLLLFVLFTAAAVGVGYVTGMVVEQPALRLRDRWFPSRAGGLAVGQEAGG